MTDYAKVYERYFDECLDVVRDFLCHCRSNPLPSMKANHESNKSSHIFNLAVDDSALVYYSDLIERIDIALSRGLEGLVRTMLDEAGQPYASHIGEGREAEWRYREIDLVIWQHDVPIGLVFTGNYYDEIMRVINRAEDAPAELASLSVVVTTRSKRALPTVPRPSNNKVGIVTVEELFDITFPGQYDTFLTQAETFCERVCDEIALGIVDVPTATRMRDIKPAYLRRLNRDLEHVKTDILSGTCIPGKYVLPLESGQAKELYNNFHNKGRDVALIGSADFAQSFISSEWLFGIHGLTQELEQTGAAVGYIKSVEQLLYRIALLHNEETYVMRRLEGGVDKSRPWDTDYPHAEELPLWSLIDFFSEETNLGLLCIDPPFSSLLQSVLHEFRSKDRNKYLHKENLIGPEAFERLAALRHKVQLIYLLVLGGCSMTSQDLAKLGVSETKGVGGIEEAVSRWAEDIVDLPSFQRDIIYARAISIWVTVNTDVPEARKFLGMPTCKEWELNLTLDQVQTRRRQFALSSAYTQPFKCSGEKTWEHMAVLVKRSFERAIRNNKGIDDRAQPVPIEITYTLIDESGKIWDYRLTGKGDSDSLERTQMILKGNSFKKRKKDINKQL